MKLALAPRPAPRITFAAAAVALGRAVAAAVPPPPKRRSAGFPVGPGSVAAYLAVTALDVRQADAARALGCTRANIFRTLRRVEALRDEPAFDAALDAATEEMCPA